MTKHKQAAKNEVAVMENLAPQMMANSIDMATSLEEKKKFAEEMIKSGLLPATLATPGHLEDEDLRDGAIGAVIAIVEYGRELKITPWVALHGMHVVAGKVVVGVHIYTGLAAKAGIIIDVEKDYERIYKKGAKGEDKLVDIITTVSFTQYIKTPMGPKEIIRRHSKRWSEIKKAGLDTRDNYTKRPATMLRTRAIVEGLRLYAADLYMGALEHTEMLDENHQNYTIDIEGQVVGDEE